jgi:hypothetical protein
MSLIDNFPSFYLKNYFLSTNIFYWKTFLELALELIIYLPCINPLILLLFQKMIIGHLAYPRKQVEP